MPPKHKWTVTDDIVAYYFYHYKGFGLNCSTTSSIALSLGMPQKSFEARVQNVAWVVTNGAHGLSNAATQTVDVVNLFEFSRLNDPNFQTNLQTIINRYL